MDHKVGLPLMPAVKRGIKRGNGVSLEEAMTVFYGPLSATFDEPDH